VRGRCAGDPSGNRGIHMCELPKDASLQPTQVESCARNRVAELAAQADLMLARYPVDVREQITELLRVLAERPIEAGKGVR
jgi:hypothetical protein